MSAFAIIVGGDSLLLVAPALALVAFGVLAFGLAASVRYGVGVRRAAAAVAMVLGFALFAPRVGQRDRTESTAIGALRAIVSGEWAYASINEGYYDTLQCLAAPSCVPSKRGGQNAFLDPELAAAKERRGYRFEFHAGPKAERESDKRRSRSAMTRFAVVAIPMNPGTAQHRAFCADDTGTIYFTRGGTVPRVDGGRCLDTANPLR